MKIGIDSTDALVIDSELAAQALELAASHEYGVDASIISIPSLGRTPLLHVPGKGVVPVRTKPIGEIKTAPLTPEEAVTKCKFMILRRQSRLYHLRTWADIVGASGTNRVTWFATVPTDELDGSFQDVNVQENWELLGVTGLVKIPSVVAAHTTPLTSATVDQMYDAIKRIFDGHMTIKRGSVDLVRRFELENLMPDLHIQTIQDDGTIFRTKLIAKPKKHIMFSDLMYNLRQPIVIRKDDRLYVEWRLRNTISLADMPLGPTASNEFRNSLRIGISFIGNHEEEQVVE